ncbi:hypothetical protein [Thalassotalea crassostreae]|nr:hypothetical protein [Thalassotalea crassostreae]
MNIRPFSSLALLLCSAILVPIQCLAQSNSTTKDISHLVSKEQFISYKDVGEFIDASPKVTIMVESSASDVEKYGEGVVKSLTGSDCDRDGKMDDNATCNAVYLKLWIKYQR